MQILLCLLIFAAGSTVGFYFGKKSKNKNRTQNRYFRWDTQSEYKEDVPVFFMPISRQDSITARNVENYKVAGMKEDK